MVGDTFSTTKDWATNDRTRGWCRVMGATATSLFATTAFVTRNERVLDALAARQADDARRQAQGLPPRTRRRRRKGIGDLVGAGGVNAPPG